MGQIEASNGGQITLSDWLTSHSPDVDNENSRFLAPISKLQFVPRDNRHFLRLMPLYINCFILLALKPVLVGLKSPVIMINASGCLERKWSTFD